MPPILPCISSHSPVSHAGAGLDPEIEEAMADVEGAADRACRAVEGCVEAITCRVRFQAAPAAEAVPDDRVMLLEQTLVPVITHPGLFPR